MPDVKYRTIDNRPNVKTIVGTVAAFLVPAVAAWVADAAGVTDVQALESVLLGLLSAAGVFTAEYVKRPAAGDGVIAEVPVIPPDDLDATPSRDL